MTSAACRALVLEDDRAIARLLHAILEREEFAVQLAATRAEAIRQIGTDRFHLVVLDLMVPDGDVEVIDFVKQNHLELLKAIVVISADARAINATLRGEYPEPICKFIAKPFDVHQLTTAIHSCKQLCGEAESVVAP